MPAPITQLEHRPRRPRSRRKWSTSPSARSSTPELIRDEVAAGRMVIPANKVHPPGGWSRWHRHRRPLQDQRQHRQLGRHQQRRRRAGKAAHGRPLRRRHGDGPVDRQATSTRIRQAIIDASPVPIGTVPIYQMLAELDGNIEDMTPQHLLDMVEHQAKQGVDYMTDPRRRAARAPAPDDEPRHRHRQPRRLADRQVDDGPPQAEPAVHALRRPVRHHAASTTSPGAWATACGPARIADASDEAQFAELDVAGRTDPSAAGTSGTQVMVEGPGHIPMDQIDMNIKRQIEVCHEAPVLRARPAGDRHRPRLRPHHQRHRRGPGRLERRGDALLRHAEGTPGPARTRRRASKA